MSRSRRSPSRRQEAPAGSDGSCAGTYLCVAGATGGNKYKTYSGPAGWGSPNGINAF